MWSTREHAPNVNDYAMMWLETGVVFCNVYTSDSEEDSQLQMVPQNIEPPLSCQCTATRNKLHETPLDLSIHEDSPEKVVHDMYIKPSITRKYRRADHDSDCQLCDFEAETERNLAVHMKSYHPNDWPYHC